MAKILHINVTYKKTSTGSIVWDLTRNDQLFQSRVLFSYGDTEDLIASKYETKIDSIDRRLKNKIFGKKSGHGRNGTNHLIHEITEFNPDIIHLHVLHHGILDYKRLFRFLGSYGKPVVYTMHDCWAFTGGCYYYSVFGCSKFKDGCNDCKRSGFDELDCKVNKTNLNWKIKKDLLLKIDGLRIVGVSQWLCDEIRRSFLKNKSIFCIPNGINTSVFCKGLCNKSESSTSLVAEQKKYTILGVCDHWNARKGLNRFIQLANRLDRNKYRIVLVGEEPEPVENNYPEMIHMVGRTKTVEDLVDWYRSADVFVNMSFEETFGLVTAEAACVGIMVVGFDSTANTELIKNVGGILVEKDDMEGMAKVVIQTCTNNVRISEEKLKNARQYYSKERMIQDYKDLYRKILEERVSK